jgi:hypothetical protein
MNEFNKNAIAAVPHQKNLYLLIQLLLPTKENANSQIMKDLKFGNRITLKRTLEPKRD